METTNHNNELEQLTCFLADLRLKHWAGVIKNDLSAMPPQEMQFLLGHLLKWAETEKAERKASLIASRIKGAKFKRIQTIDNFDFAYSKETQAVQKNYLALYNGISPQNPPSAIFTGTSGAGKTHLSRAIGYGACQKGMSVLFVTAAELVNHLTHAQKTFNLEAELNRYRRPQVLIIDELGYVTLDAQASNLFFQVISARHDQGLGIVTTTNIPFGKFNQIFANDAIAHAIVDRLVNDAEIFYMDGPSYREHQRAQKQKSKNKDN